MNQAISFDAYLNKNRPDRDTILTAARFIANRWVDFRTSDKIREEIQASAPNEPGLIGAVNSLDSDGDFLERFALAVLSVAWRDDQRLVEAAFDEAEGGLISKETTILGTTALIVFGLWTWQSNGGQTLHYQKTVRNPDGSFTTEERSERQPFPSTCPASFAHSRNTTTQPSAQTRTRLSKLRRRSSLRATISLPTEWKVRTPTRPPRNTSGHKIFRLLGG